MKRFLPELSTMSVTELMFEVKRLRNFAYRLDIDEAKEIMRGKHLKIFKRIDIKYILKR